MLETDADGMAVEVDNSCKGFITFVAMQQITAEDQSGKLVSDMEVHTKQRCITEFLYAANIAPTDIHQCLLRV
jgi:hypothetical protein